MAISTEELFRLGILTDPTPAYKTQREEIRSQTNKGIEDQINLLKSGTLSDFQANIQEKKLDFLYRNQETRLRSLEKRYDSAIATNERLLSNPGTWTRARMAIEQEVAQERAQLQEETRRATEGIQRGEAEREAARAKSRRAGGGRGMLAGYGLSVPQGIGGKSTLGLAGPVGSPTGGGRASTLGRSLLG
jgi:hypothetical protein